MMSPSSTGIPSAPTGCGFPRCSDAADGFDDSVPNAVEALSLVFKDNEPVAPRGIDAVRKQVADSIAERTVHQGVSSGIGGHCCHPLAHATSLGRRARDGRCARDPLPANRDEQPVSGCRECRFGSGAGHGQ